MYERRFYRDWIERDNLEGFEVKIRESDLYILSEGDLQREAALALQEVRDLLEGYIARRKQFATSLEPILVDDDAPEVIATMARASRTFGVGPMASVAGAVAEFVGKRLLETGSKVVLVENGGDIYGFAKRPLNFALYAGGESPFGNNLSFAVDGSTGIGVCTSSGRVGPSLSFGNADAVVAIAENAALADAAATAIGNDIRSPSDVDRAVEKCREGSPLKGLIVCCGDRLGVFGDLELSRR